MIVNNSNFKIFWQEQGFYFCKAFQKIINLPLIELAEELGNQESLTAAKDYFANLSSESYHNPMVIANHIAAFCRRSENEKLNKLLKKFYLNLNPDGIDKLTTKRDPDDKTDAEPEETGNLTNEARDVCKDIEGWAKQDRDNNQRDLNDSNPN